MEEAKSEIVKVNVEKAIEDFKAAFQMSMEALGEACKIYVEVITAEPSAKEKFEKAMPMVSRSAWARFEAVGRKQLDVRLLGDSTLAGSRLRRLPVSVQAEVLDKGVEVMTKEKDTLKVKLENLTPSLVAQVFAYDHVRTVGEQRAWLESKKLAAAVEEKPKDLWSIDGNELVIMGPARLSRKQLLGVLGEMG